MLTPDAIAILSVAYDNIGKFALQVVRNIAAGVEDTPDQKELYDKGVRSTILYTTILKHIVLSNDGLSITAIKASATTPEINSLLFCLREVAEVYDLPAIPKPLVVTNVAINAGPAGPTGPQGQNQYFYVGYATDNAGSGFATTPDPTRKYIGFYQSTTPVTNAAALYAGNWIKYIGDNGSPGTAGNNGQNVYIYQAWADDSIGTGFTNTFNSAKKYTAFKTSTTPLSPPVVGDFSGLWTKYVGDNGSNGSNGTNGNTVLSGTVDPVNTQGVNGDFYINYGSDPVRLFGPKAAGTWPAGISIKGNTGNTGGAGTNGTNGTSMYTYIAWASDTLGTGFTTTFDPNKDYVAILVTSTLIASPAVGDFTGLWTKYRGDGDNWTTNSNTSQTIGTGVKVWVVATNLAYSTGQRVVASVPADPTHRMEGICQGYDPTNGQLTLNIDTTYGSGTYGTWDISLQGAPISIASVEGYFATIATDQGSGGSTQSTSTTPAKLTAFDTVVSQSAGMLGDATNDNITVSNPGSYNVAFQGVVSGSANADFTIQIYKNGSAISKTKTRVKLDGSGNPQNVNIGPMGISGVAANDVFDVRVTASTGTPNILLEQGSFTVYSIGSTSSLSYLKFSVPANTGTTNIDLISTSIVKSVIWEVSVQNGNNIKTVIITAATNGLTGGSNTTWSEAAISSIGTIDVTWNVDVNSGNLRLQAVSTSNGWTIAGLRRILG